jgi:catechol 2,3-dioxygenase-like lactoylglutathione lyase family enzyme
MLPSPDHAVIGVSDPDRSVDFLRLLGFAEVASGELDGEAAAGLYGLEESAHETVLQVPGARRGYLRLVTTPNPPRQALPLDSRAFAIDLFSSDIEESLRVAEEAGLHASPIVTHQFGPISIREVEVRGPDGIVVTLLESEARRPTILDREPDRLHSEVHAWVWSVKGIDRLLPFWLERAGQEKLTDAVLETPDLGALLGVPDREIKARLVVLGDADAHPIRLEMIEFLGEPAVDQPSFPLAAGLHAPAFRVEDLDGACRKLEGAQFGPIVALDTAVHKEARAVSAVAPGDLRFELWEEGST